jgi:predicted anti-sigma-YlaC factor YlaD
MSGTDHSTYREWLDLDLEGALTGDEGERLAAHLVGCADCRAERQRLVALHRMIETSRVEVRPGFGASVMAALPEPAWATPPAARHRWAWAAALVGVLGSLSAVLLLLSGARLAPGASLAGALAAVAEMVGTALIAGAGLLGASWTGVGLAVADLFARSPGTLVACALLVVFLALLTVSLLRRPRRVAERARRRR